VSATRFDDAARPDIDYMEIWVAGVVGDPELVALNDHSTRIANSRRRDQQFAVNGRGM
jgi:hypothetical protein